MAAPKNAQGWSGKLSSLLLFVILTYWPMVLFVDKAWTEQGLNLLGLVSLLYWLAVIRERQGFALLQRYVHGDKEEVNQLVAGVWNFWNQDAFATQATLVKLVAVLGILHLLGNLL